MIQPHRFGRSVRVLIKAMGALAMILALAAQAVAASGREGALGAVNVRDPRFGARGDGRTDDTSAIQRAIDLHASVYLPPGVYLVDPRRGLRLRNGTQIRGAGIAATVIVAAPGGGGIADLAAYRPRGVIIGRDFNPEGPNPYIAYVYLADFAVLLTHPKDQISRSEIQIGIDLRNVTRSVVERVHVGNTPPVGSPVTRANAHMFDSQGYGVVVGTLPSSLAGYAGGEMNVIRDVHVWGAFKGVVLDDADLSPRSGAHGTIVERADVQGAQLLLSQESEYARAVTWRDNVLQNVVPQPDGHHAAGVMRIDGRDIRVSGGYVEAGGLARYGLRLGPLSANVAVDVLHIGCVNPLRLEDLGQGNMVATGGQCLRPAAPK